MIEIKSPTPYDDIAHLDISNKKMIFLAGGISNIWNWQEVVVSELNKVLGPDVICFNPRRDNFDMSNTKEAIRQIRWEHLWLTHADIIAFWFSSETLQPITLFELGTHTANRNKKIVVGVHPDYQRDFDVRTQIMLFNKSRKAGQEIQIANTLITHIDNIIDLVKQL